MADIKNNLSTNLVSYWSLDEASGTRYDAHGSNNLTDNNTVQSGTGKYGNCAYSGASTEYLRVSSDLGIDTATAYSISSWVKFDSLPVNVNDQAYWISLQKGTGQGYLNLCIQKTGSAPDVYKINADGANILATVTIAAGTWYHCVFTKASGSGGATTVYWNGSSVGTGTDITTGGGTGTFDIGIWGAQGTSFRYCSVDEVGVWTTELSSGNVTTLYNSGNGIKYLDATSVSGNTALNTNLAAYWKLEEGSGATRNDEVGTLDLTDNTTVASGTGIQGSGADFIRANNEYLERFTSGGLGAISVGSGLLTSRTVSFWWKPDSLSSFMTPIMLWGNAAGESQFFLYCSSAGLLTLSDNGSGMHTDPLQTATGAISSGSWNHVVMVEDGTANTTTIYVNAVSKASGSFNEAVGAAADDLWVGSQNGPSNVTDGVIDELGIWSRALTFGEIVALYNAGTGLPYAPAGVTFVPRASFFM